MLDNANLMTGRCASRGSSCRSRSSATQLVTFGVMLASLLVANLIVIPRDARRRSCWRSRSSLLAVAFVAGLALAVASLNVVFRDVEFICSRHSLLPWFFLTPILYPLEDLPGGFKRYHYVRRDPALGEPAHAADRAPCAIRSSTAGCRTGATSLYLVVAAAFALALGAWVFSRVDDRIAVEL